MNKKLRTELLVKFDQISLETFSRVSPGTNMDQEQLADIWRRLGFRKAFEARCRELPDEMAPLLQNELEKFPDQFRRQVRDATRHSASGFGGRTPLLPDHLRLQACEDVKKLQEQGFKLPKAIADTAARYGLTPAQLMGIWKHKPRYKGGVKGSNSTSKD